MDRSALEAEWLALTRERLPAAARERGWPIHLDHCFMRVLLDHAHRDQWTRHVAKRPAYKHVSDEALARAVEAGQAALAGAADRPAMNRESLAWRGKAGPASARASPRP